MLNIVMESLPVAVMVRIFSFLEVKEKCNAARVCRSWYHLVREKQLWKYVDLTPFRVNLQATWKIIRCYFTDALRTLHLRGFMYSIKKTECLSNAVLKDLCERCPNLEELHIKDALLTNIDSGNLPPTLKVLTLQRCATPSGWFQSAVDQGRFGQLQVLSMSWSTGFCDKDLIHLASLPGGGQLESLDFSNCYRISHQGFLSMAENLTCLKHLHIPETNVEDEDMHFICRHLKEMKTLTLHDCEALTDLCIGSLATLTNLQHLDMRGSAMKITAGALIGLVGKLKNLECLCISVSEGLTEADLEQIAGVNVKCRIISN
ncbi:F-box/LRR-repeat protein 12-like [Acanthaster planci]|uniref:F-box/LRR-repeat protein 12-like n=1 Tax=Acanthaster planci TaxID=133434 RepID=A0A8B7ZIR4_ACAPL|nr:F-box/LRR-repeat protein 12-like [Acanthaster planci]